MLPSPLLPLSPFALLRSLRNVQPITALQKGTVARHFSELFPQRAELVKERKEHSVLFKRTQKNGRMLRSFEKNAYPTLFCQKCRQILEGSGNSAKRRGEEGGKEATKMPVKHHLVVFFKMAKWHVKTGFLPACERWVWKCENDSRTTNLRCR